MTHQYTLLTGGRVVRGDGEPDATAIAWAADTILLVGTDEEAAAISRGDSMRIDLGGAVGVGLGPLEVGGPADFDVVREGGTARIRGGRLESGELPGRHEHSDGAHDHSAGGDHRP